MTRGLIPLIVLATLLAGCKKADPKPTPTSGPVAAEEPAADDAPGQSRWTDAQIEQTVREDMKFTALTLTKASRDRYTGTGTDATGKAWKVVVRYRAGEYRIDAEAAEQPPGGHDVRASHWAAEGVTPKWKTGGK